MACNAARRWQAIMLRPRREVQDGNGVPVALMLGKRPQVSEDADHHREAQHHGQECDAKGTRFSEDH